MSSQEPHRSTCSACGRHLDEHNRHVRFVLPDPVLDLPEREQTEGTWMTHADANSSVMMQVPDVGSFIRVLVPIHLTDGYTVTFGAWLGVHPDELRRAFNVWWEPEYDALQLEGHLANALPRWGLLAAPSRAAVRQSDQTPYLVSSTDPLMADVLSAEWSHEAVLGSLP